ncbi:MAG TPA: hypothetical protein VFW24_06235, partial [Acidimicrobiales bacterium]|nr:hypothetical protein [Acidimicrobiales bacterium]
DDVAVAVEECVLSGEPPARIVVGDDAEGFARLLKDATADDLAGMLRDYVAQMGAPVSTPGPSSEKG